MSFRLPPSKIVAWCIVLIGGTALFAVLLVGRGNPARCGWANPHPSLTFIARC